MNNLYDYIAISKKKSILNLADYLDWEIDYALLRQRGCIWQATKHYTCRDLWCVHHGRYRRGRRCNRILADLDRYNKLASLVQSSRSVDYHTPAIRVSGEEDEKYTFLTFKFNCLLSAGQFSKCRKEVLRVIKKENPDMQYLWVVHFVDYCPHLHVLVRSSVLTIGKYNRYTISRLLNRLGHDEPSRCHVYQRECDDVQAAITYLFQLDRDLPKQECPLIRDWWRLTGMSKGFVENRKTRVQPTRKDTGLFTCHNCVSSNLIYASPCISSLSYCGRGYGASGACIDPCKLEPSGLSSKLAPLSVICDTDFHRVDTPKRCQVSCRSPPY
jgi:hypothetical protein